MNTDTQQQDISRMEVITALKKKFFGNDPASWSSHSNTTLLEWYKEYILEDKTSKIKIR
jgi:hypothetical protein